MVKAFANEGSDRDPYDLKNYEGIANEYIPNLKVETVVKEGDVELGEDDPFFKYVDLPSSTAIDYKTWLASEYKETGYKVTLNFTWSKETLGGQNPEQAWKGLSVEEQETKYQELISALKDVKFTFKFIVGNDDGVVEEPETPTTTDVITLPKVEGSTLTIEGLNDGVVEAGEHALTLDITEENKALKDSTLFVTKSSKDGVKTEDKVVLEESGNRSIFKSYEGTYNFEAEYAYTFSYELEDTTPTITEEYKTIYIKDLKGLNNYGSQTFIYAWNSNDPSIINADYPGIKMDTYCWNAFDDEASVFKTELNVGKYTDFLVTSFLAGNDPYAQNAQPNGKTRDININELGNDDFVQFGALDESKGLYDVTFANFDETIAPFKANIKLSYDETKGNVSFDSKEHFNNETIPLNIEPNPGYVLSSVTLNNEIVNATDDGKYYVTLTSGDNNIEVIFEDTIKYGTLELVSNDNVTISATADGEEVTATQLPVGTIVTLNFEILVDNYVIEDVLLNDAISIYKEGDICSFEIVEGVNKITIVGKAIVSDDAFSNPKVVETTEIKNTENGTTYFETTCLVKSLRTNGFVMTDPNNFDTEIQCNLLYSAEDKLITNSEYSDGLYSLINKDDSSDKFDANSLDVGDLVKVRGFTNSTGYFKGALIEKVKDSSEIKYAISATCEEGGSVTTPEAEAPVNTEITLDITCPEGKKINTVTFNGTSVTANSDGQYVITTTFVNNINVTFIDVGIVTFETININTSVLKAKSYTEPQTTTIDVKNSNGESFKVAFEVKAHNSNGYQFNKEKGGCYLRNTTPLPSAIDHIVISGFNQSAASSYLVYSTSTEIITESDIVCDDSLVLPALGENDVYFNIAHNETAGVCNFTSITIYLK